MNCLITAHSIDVNGRAGWRVVKLWSFLEYLIICGSGGRGSIGGGDKEEDEEELPVVSVVIMWWY